MIWYFKTQRYRVKNPERRKKHQSQQRQRQRNTHALVKHFTVLNDTRWYSTMQIIFPPPQLTIFRCPSSMQVYFRETYPNTSPWYMTYAICSRWHVSAWRNPWPSWRLRCFPNLLFLLHRLRTPQWTSDSSVINQVSSLRPHWVEWVEKSWHCLGIAIIPVREYLMLIEGIAVE